MTATLLFCSGTNSVHALTIGPAQTKLERQRSERRLTSSGSVTTHSSVRFENIEESYLNEDFASVERLSGDFLSGQVRDARAPEVRYLRAVALIKLGKRQEGLSELSALSASNIPADLKNRVEGTLNYVQKPMASPAPVNFHPLRQMAVEESSYYCVQVGSFSKRLNAERLMQKLLNCRFDAYMKQDMVSRLYRVRVGQLSSRDEAVDLERRLKKDGYPTRIFP